MRLAEAGCTDLERALVQPKVRKKNYYEISYDYYHHHIIELVACDVR